MATLSTGNFSDIDGDIYLAGGDIINNIQTLERALTPGEVAEKDLQIEMNELERCVRVYLARLKDQIVNDSSPDPYKGLEAYTFSESQIFFGRNQAMHNLLHAIQRRSLTVLQAESGAGKTSLLQAGIIPRLMVGKNLAILIRPQFENPSQAIKKVFIGNPEVTPKLLRAPLVDFLRRVTDLIGQETTLYLILDQFEEFFSKKTLEQDRQEFLADLAACLKDAMLKVHWIISITTDVFGQLGKIEHYIQTPFSNVQSLYLFNRDEAKQIIAKPAEQNKLSFEDGLIDRLLDDLDKDHREEIAPTQIQLVCAALYDDLQGEDKRFTLERYSQRGGAQGILHDYIANVLNRNLPHEERAVAYKVFERLVTSEKKRVLRDRSDLEIMLAKQGVAPETLESTLNHLVKCRLLRRLGDDAQHLQYEIVHDYLLSEIEIDEGARNAKEAEELIQDGLKAWKRNKNLLLTKEHLVLIERQFEQKVLTLNEESAELLALSAAVNSRSMNNWLAVLSNEKIHNITSQSVKELKSNDRYVRTRSRQVAWAMRVYLPRNTYRRLYVERLFFSNSWVLVTVLLIMGLSFQPVKAWLFYPEFSDWERLSSFEQQTHANLPALSLSINLDNPDEVYASDQTPGVLYTSQDGGQHWKQTTPGGMNAAILALSLVAENRLYALTQDAVWVSQDQGQSWQPTRDLHVDQAERLMSISVNPRNAAEVYVGGNQGNLYHTLDQGQSWEEIREEGYAGKQIKALATNGNVLVIATDEGLWVNSRETKRWSKISLIGCQGEQDISSQVSALAIPSPFDDPSVGGAIGLWAAVSGIGICDTDTENAYETSLYQPIPESLSSMAVTGDVVLQRHAYIGAEEGILRYRTWFSNDAEWWKIKIHSLTSRGGKNE